MGPELLILIVVVVIVFGIFHIMQYLGLRSNTRAILEQTNMMGSLINELREQGHTTETKLERLEGRLQPHMLNNLINELREQSRATETKLTRMEDRVQRFEENYEHLRRAIGTRQEDLEKA